MLGALVSWDQSDPGYSCCCLLPMCGRVFSRPAAKPYLRLWVRMELCAHCRCLEKRLAQGLPSGGREKPTVGTLSRDTGV